MPVKEANVEDAWHEGSARGEDGGDGGDALDDVDDTHSRGQGKGGTVKGLVAEISKDDGCSENRQDQGNRDANANV